MVGLSNSFCCSSALLLDVSLLFLFLGSWISYEVVRFNLDDYLFCMYWYGASSFSGSMWFVPFYSTYGLSFDPLGIGYRAVSVFDSGWVEYFGGEGL